MSNVTCPSCGNLVETAMSPGESVTCHLCTQTFAAPGDPPARPRLVKPGAAGRSAQAAPRLAGGGRTAPRPRRPEPAVAAGRNRLYLMVGGAAVLVLVGVIFLIQGGGDDVDTPATPDPAPNRGTEAPPVRSGSVPERQPEVVTPQTQLAKLMAAAGTPEAWLAAADFAAKQGEALKAEPGKESERKMFESRVEQCLLKAVGLRPDFEPARPRLEALGHVYFSLPEAEAWVEATHLPKRLRDSVEICLEELRPHLPDGARSGWITGPAAAKYGPFFAEARAFDRAVDERDSDPWYQNALRVAERFEAELGDKLRRDDVDRAFEPVIVRPYLVLVQKDKSGKELDHGYEAALNLRSLHEAWVDRFGGKIEMRPFTNPIPVLLLYSHDDYVVYQRRGDTLIPTVIMSAGHFEPWNGRLVVYRSSPDELRNTLFHEGTHQLVYYNNVSKLEHQAEQSMWFDEGIAEYFGGNGTKDGSYNEALGLWKYEPGRINTSRLDFLGSTRARNEFMPIAELVKISRALWNRDQQDPTRGRWSQLTYAEGWALIYFLNHYDNGRYAADFVAYMKEELKGNSGIDGFTSVFGKHGLEKLDGEFGAFVDMIVQKHKDGKIVNGRIIP